MAQKDSQLVIRARDEASKALQAISKALEDFSGAQADAAKSSGATSSTLARLGQSLADLGRASAALGGVAKISDQFAKAQTSVTNLEEKLEQATKDLGDFQSRATESAVATAALSAQADAAQKAETSQIGVVKAIADAHRKAATEIRGEEAALEKLNARVVKAAPTASPQMANDLAARRAALDAQKAQQAQAQQALDAERAALERLIAARKAANQALADGEREQGKYANSAKVAQTNVDGLTAGLERSRGTLAEIQATFTQAAEKTGLSAASATAVAEAQTRLKATTDAATAAIVAQGKAQTTSAESAARAIAFQASLRAATQPKPEDVAAPVARARGALAQEADRQRTASDASGAATARERIQLDGLSQSLDKVARSRAAQRTSPAVPASPAAGVGAAPGGSTASAPGAAASATAAFREQLAVVASANETYRAAATALTELGRAMAGATPATIEQTAAFNAQKLITETAKASLDAETKQLASFRDAVRAASDARAAQAKAGDDARRAQSTVVLAVPQPSRAVAPQLTQAAAATQNYRDQVRAADETRASYERNKTALEELYRTQAAGGEASSELTAAIAAQRAATDAAEAAALREKAALDALRQSIRDTASAADAAREGRLAPATPTTAAAPTSSPALTTARVAAVASVLPPSSAPAGAPAQATAAFKEQVAAAAAASAAYAEAQTRLQALYKEMSTAVGPTEELKAALAAQRVEWAAAQAEMQRENAALQTMRAAVSEATSARKQQAAAEREAAASMTIAHDAGIAAVGAIAEEVANMGLLERVILRVKEAQAAYGAAVSGSNDQHSALISNLKNLAGAYVTVFTAINAFKDIVKTAADTEASQVRISTALGGSQEQGAIAFEHAANAARQLKLDILPTVDGYGKFLAVVKDTPLAGAGATKTFDDLLTIIRAFKLAPESMDLVIKALISMAARGHVAAQELNRIDIDLPVGFRQAIAQTSGFGDNMTAFAKAVHDGKIGLDQIQPALDKLAESAKGGLGEALKTAQSSFADFRNALFDFKNAIANGDFMKGIVDGVNALSSVIRDPSASEGLRGIADGFGRLLTFVAELAPYAHSLFAVLSAIAAVKLVSMVASFQTLYQVIGSLFASLAQFGAAGIFGIFGGLEAGLAGIIALITGPAGIALGVAVVAGGFAYWLTGTKSAQEGLVSYKNTLDSIKGSLLESGGDATKLGTGVADLPISAIEQQLASQKRYFDQTAASVDTLGARIKASVSSTQLVGEFGDFQSGTNAEIGALAALFAKYKEGQISITDFRTQIEELNKTFTDPQAKDFAAQLSDAATKSAVFSNNVLVLEGALLAAGAKLNISAEEAKRAGEAYEAMWKEAAKGGPALDALDKYKQALDGLLEKVPALKQKLAELNNEQDITSKVLSGRTDLSQKYGAGVIDSRDLRNNTQQLTDAAATARAAGATQEFEKTKSYDDQVFEARQYLQANSDHPDRPGDTTELHPDFAIELATAFKAALAEGIQLKLTSGFREPGQTGSKYDAEGFSSHSYGIAADVNGTNLKTGQPADPAKVAAILGQAGAYNPYGSDDPKEFNHFQLLPTKLENDPDLLKALQAAKNAGDTGAMFAAASPPGAAKKATTQHDEDVRQDAEQDEEDDQRAKKGIQDAQELLQTEQARVAVVVGLANYKKQNPDASQADLDNEKKLLITQQAELEVKANVDKYKDQNPTATKEQIDAYTQLQEKIHALTAERATDSEVERSTSKTASENLAQLNSLVTQRRGLMKELATATESGDDSKLDKVKGELTENKSASDALIDSLTKMYETLGGAKGAEGLQRLNTIKQGLTDMTGKVQIFGLSVKQTQELANDFVNDVASAFDTFAEEIASGVKPIQALGDAFRKFASDFLKQIADMIIKAELFKLLGLTQGGVASGGGLLGSLSGASTSGAASGAAGAAASGGGSIFSSIGSFFSSVFHSGGVVGEPAMTRQVSPLVFAGAQRYHDGGLIGLSPDEIPIIAKKNEEVLTANDPRHRDNGGMAVNNVAKQPRIVNLFDAPTFLSAALGAPEGEQAIMNYVRANAGAIKAAINA